jgi:hypothetical protein
MTVKVRIVRLDSTSVGNLYSTAIGGAHFSGVVFRLSRPPRPESTWMYNLLYTFLGDPDGHYSANGLVIMVETTSVAWHN